MSIEQLNSRAGEHGVEVIVEKTKIMRLEQEDGRLGIDSDGVEMVGHYTLWKPFQCEIKCTKEIKEELRW